MAEQVVRICDLDHDGVVMATTTVTVDFDGVSGRYDLCTEHMEQVQALLKSTRPRTQARATRAPRRAARSKTPAGTPRSGRRSRTASGSRQLPAAQEEIRAWARSQGLAVSDRGRLSRAIVAQFQEAHSPTA